MDDLDLLYDNLINDFNDFLEENNYTLSSNYIDEYLMSIFYDMQDNDCQQYENEFYEVLDNYCNNN